MYPGRDTGGNNRFRIFGKEKRVARIITGFS